MPIYEYQCKKCGHVFDALQKAGEGALRKCPECGKLALDKLLSAPALQVKGKEGGAANRAHTHGPGCGHKH